MLGGTCIVEILASIVPRLCNLFHIAMHECNIEKLGIEPGNKAIVHIIFNMCLFCTKHMQAAWYF